jgi:hypothetical protein
MRAQAAIIKAAWKLRRIQIGNLVTTGGDTAHLMSQAAPESSVRPDDATARATELALAVGRAAAHGIVRPQCLVRSIALRNLLSERGIPGSVIRVGVRRDAGGGPFVAHAWVELNGAVIGDDLAHVSRFTPLDSVGVGAAQ